jgi:inner membrane protein
MKHETPIPWHKSYSVQITSKLALILILTLILLIPKFAILELVQERLEYYNQVIEEVSQGWGREQYLTAPVLVIPYKTKVKKEKGETVMIEQLLVVASDDCNINSSLDTIMKKRSIYDILLYKTNSTITGHFALDDIPRRDNSMIIEPEKAFIALAIGDIKGLDGKVDFAINGNKIPSKMGLQGLTVYVQKNTNVDYQSSSTPLENNHYSKILENGLHVPFPISINGNQKYNFELKVILKGSKSMNFIANSLNFKAQLKSTFPHPSFVGDYLPEHTTSAKGFDATWNILEYNNNISPFYQNCKSLSINDCLIGISIKPLLNHYVSTYRAGKYMVLVIVLTFLSILIIELTNKHRVHIFQYTLIGIAIALFFILLLSFSEVTGFTYAFIIASFATIGLTYMYCTSVFNDRRSTLMVVILQVLIYGFIFSILRMEETSLLFGSIGLFIILACTMYFTRSIQWYEDPKSHQKDLIKETIE